MRTSFLLAIFTAVLSLADPARAQFCPGANGWVFDDVPANDLFCGYITWAAKNGVTQGCAIIDANHRLYCPNESVARNQMAAFTSRLAHQPNSTAPDVGTITKPGGTFLHNYGSWNTFAGVGAGNFSMIGAANNAFGFEGLASNTSGSNNTSVGTSALTYNTTGSYNTAVGAYSMRYSTTGASNTALGNGALINNTAGNGNTAVGLSALPNSYIGDGNIAIGLAAGYHIDGSMNVAIGNSGAPSESGTIRIGDYINHSRTFVAGIRGVTTGANDAVNVVIDGNGQLGTISSSRDGKNDIADMSDASAALMRLRPVTFHYKADHDAAGSRLQYGLIAEEVAEVYPGMVTLKDGKPETVMYQYLPPMLLNEYQKQQRTIEAQARDLQIQRSEIENLRRSYSSEIAEIRRAMDVLLAKMAPHAQVATH